MDIHENIFGRIWRLGDHINTDLLHPPSCFSLDETRMRSGLLIGMGRLDLRLQEDDSGHDLIIVAGENFGCGSSRETSVRALSSFGVRAIIAKSFARIFYRSLVNRGIIPLVCGKLQDKVKDSDPIRIFMDKQQIVLMDSEHIPFEPFDPHIKKILECGGLISYLKIE